MQEAEEIKLTRIKMFHETETIASQLPIDIEGIEISDFYITCPKCNHEIEQHLIHGYATKPLPNTASFHAVFICPHCRVICEDAQRIKRTGKNTIAVHKLTGSGKWLFSEMNIRGEHWVIRLMKLVLGKQ